MVSGETPEVNKLSRLDAVIRERIASDSNDSYVCELHRKGINKILEKVGEESTEFILAAKDCSANLDPSRTAQMNKELVNEAADLWFHSLIALAECGLTSNEVLQELDRRLGISGIEEKASRTINND